MIELPSYKITAMTKVDQQMIELLSDILVIDESRVIEIALHEWLEANFVRVNSLHRNTVSAYKEMYPNSRLDWIPSPRGN
jgi:hypothetical protein